jgi:hypothetical protein
LHPLAYVYASSVWFEIRRGGRSRSNVVFSCHSARSNGQKLDTGSLSPAEWNPEFTPPGHDIINVWPETSQQKVIEAHLARAKSEFDLQQFNQDTLRRHMVATGQQLFDHMISKGYFEKLTREEVERIRQQPI